jgi:hypothetical protein
VVIKIIPQLKPVEFKRRQRDLAEGRSFLASIKTMSQVGASISAVGFAGSIFTEWFNNAKAGKTSLEAPGELVIKIKLDISPPAAKTQQYLINKAIY